MKITSKYRILLTFEFFICILTIVGMMKFTHDNVYVTDVYIKESNRIIQALNNVNIDTLMAESRQRGYIITHRQDYLGNYYDILESLDEELDNLRTLIYSFNQYNIKSDYEKLVPLIRSKTEEMTMTIGLRDNKSFEAAQQEVLSHKGKRWMEQIHSLIQKMRRTTELSLYAKNRQEYASISIITYMVPILMISNVIIMILSYYMIIEKIGPVSDID